MPMFVTAAAYKADSFLFGGRVARHIFKLSVRAANFSCSSFHSVPHNPWRLRPFVRIGCGSFTSTGAIVLFLYSRSRNERYIAL